jgi:hypothetical protein
MNTNASNSNVPEAGIDRIDNVVGEFFRAQLPNPWPDAPRPWADKAGISTSNKNQASRSRWALAVSVALLVGGCWYLSGHLTDGRKRPDTNFNGTADLKHVKDAGKSLPKTP